MDVTSKMLKAVRVRQVSVILCHFFCLHENPISPWVSGGQGWVQRELSTQTPSHTPAKIEGVSMRWRGLGSGLPPPVTKVSAQWRFTNPVDIRCLFFVKWRKIETDRSKGGGHFSLNLFLTSISFRIRRLKINWKTVVIVSLKHPLIRRNICFDLHSQIERFMNVGCTLVIQSLEAPYFAFCFMRQCECLSHIYFHNMLLSNRPLIEIKLITIKTLSLIICLRVQTHSTCKSLPLRAILKFQSLFFRMCSAILLGLCKDKK